jgi:hypothetical protein
MDANLITTILEDKLGSDGGHAISINKYAFGPNEHNPANASRNWTQPAWEPTEHNP